MTCNPAVVFIVWYFESLIETVHVIPSVHAGMANSPKQNKKENVWR